MSMKPHSEQVWRDAYRRMVAGEKVRDLAAELGVDNSLMRRRWDSLGLPRLDKAVAQKRRTTAIAKAITKISPELARQAEAMNKAGMNSRQIAEKLGLGASTVFDGIRRLGVEPAKYMGPRPLRPGELTDEQFRAAFARWRSGERLEDIAKELSRTYSSLYQSFRDRRWHSGRTGPGTMPSRRRRFREYSDSGFGQPVAQ